jgi:hypothetical protein
LVFKKKKENSKFFPWFWIPVTGITSLPSAEPVSLAINNKIKTQYDDKLIIMQLPRGKYRAIKKGVQLGETLDEMTKTRFSGICLFSSDTVNGTVVFRNGIVVLAKVQNQYGDPGWAEAGLFRDHVIDAVLSDMDNAQMQLALEFNKKAYVHDGSPRHAVPPQKAESLFMQPEPVKRAADSHTKPKEKDFIKITPVSTPAAAPHPPSDGGKKSAAEAPPVSGKPAQPDPKDLPETDRSPAEKEFDTFDSMDLDDVTQKIRKDCKIILKQLQLDHLTEK